MNSGKLTNTPPFIPVRKFQTIQAGFLSPPQPFENKAGEIMMHRGEQKHKTSSMSLSHIHRNTHKHTIVTLTSISCSHGLSVLLEGSSCSLCWKSCFCSLLTQTQCSVDNHREVKNVLGFPPVYFHQ